MSTFQKLCWAVSAESQPVDGSAGVFLKSGNTTLSSAWTMLGAEVSSAQTQYVYNRGTALSCVISSGGAQIVSSGGIASDCDYYGTFYISTGGLLSGGTAIHNNATLGEAKGGTATDLTIGGISTWAYLYVTSTAALGAGVVSNLTMLTAAAFVVRPGAKAYDVLVGSSGGAYSWTYGGIIQAHDSSYLSGVTFSGGYMSAVGPHVLVEGLKIVYHKASPGFYSSAVLRGATLYPTNARVNLYTGASAYNVTVSGGSLNLEHSNTYASNVQLIGSGARIDCVGTVEDLYMSNAMDSGVCYAYVKSLGHANSVTMVGSAFCSVYSGAVASNIHLSGGPVYPNSRSALIVSAGGYASGISATSNTLMYIRGNADDIHIDSNNSTYVSSGVTVNSVYLSGGTMLAYADSLISGASICSGATVSGILSISSGSCNDVYMYNRGLLQLRSSAQATNIRLGAYCYVSSGAHMTSVTIESAGLCYVFSSGMLSGFSISSGGILYVSSGGAAAGGTVLSGAFISALGAGASISNVVNHWRVYCSSGVHFDHIVIEGSGAAATATDPQLMVYTGGSATNIVVSTNGRFTINANAVLSGCTRLAGNYCYILSGATGYAISNFAGRFAMSAGGYVSGLSQFNGAGNYNLNSAVIVEDVWIDSGASVTISYVGLTVSDITVNSNGTLVVSSGASALAVVSNPGAIIDVKAGGYIEYVV